MTFSSEIHDLLQYHSDEELASFVIYKGKRESIANTEYGLFTVKGHVS